MKIIIRQLFSIQYSRATPRKPCFSFSVHFFALARVSKRLARSKKFAQLLNVIALRRLSVKERKMKKQIFLKIFLCGERFRTSPPAQRSRTSAHTLKARSIFLSAVALEKNLRSHKKREYRISKPPFPH